MTFVQYGCGFAAGEGWANFDASPTLRIEKIPVVGKIISALFSGNGMRFPDSVQFGDIRRGPLVSAGSAKAIYASHVLEHMSLEDCRAALRHTYAMLAPGGTFRLVVPDLHERARRYVEASATTPSSATTFVTDIHMGKSERSGRLLGSLRDMLGNTKHHWMWDEPSMSEELRRAGFVDIRRCRFGDSDVRQFDRVENADRFFDPALKIHECALEARKRG